jgi:acyl carrier protein
MEPLIAERVESSVPDELTTRITGMIATTIGVAPAELGPRDSLVDVYGMESLDMLDISFRVNKEFGLKLFRGDFFQKAAEVLGVPLVADGKLTEAGVTVLKARLPEARDNSLLQVGAPRSVLARVYCVDSWVRQVSELRAANQTSGEVYLDQWLASYKQKL